MTHDDKSLLEIAAAAEGLDTSAWARGVLIRSAKRKATTITTEWLTKSVQKAPESRTE